MTDDKIFYANGLTIVMNPSEGVARFQFKVPSMDEHGMIVGEQIIDTKIIVMPREMLLALPDLVRQILEEEKKNEQRNIQEA